MTFNAELFDRASAAYDEDLPFFRTLGPRLVDVAALPTADALALRAAVIDSLERLHPTRDATSWSHLGSSGSFVR